MQTYRQSIRQFFLKELTNQKKTLFLWIPVWLGVGIVTFFTTNISISWLALGVFLTISAFISGYFLKRYKDFGSFKTLISILLLSSFVLFIAGYGIAKYRTETIDTNLLEKDMPPTEITGILEHITFLKSDTAKRVIINSIDLNGNIYRVRLKTYHFNGYNWQIGDKVSVRAKLMAPSGPVMPGGFDFSRKAFYEGISAVGYTLGEAKLLQRSELRKRQFINSIRADIGSIVYDHMNGSYAGIAQTLLTGEKSGIYDDDNEALRASGLAHLLAISGLHIGLVAGCVFFFVRLALALIPNFALHYPIKKWAALTAIIVAFCYMILAGATVPTVRAFIMTSLVLFAVILDRSALNMRLVALAAIFIMVTTPEAIMGPSFVLSFAAVSALIIFYNSAGRRFFVSANAFKPQWRPVYYLFGIIVTSVIATLATAPFSVMFFNRFAVYSVLSNILAMPLMAFVIMPSGLIAILLVPFSLDGFLWPIMEWGISQITLIAHSVSSYHNSSVYLPSFTGTETILICIGFLILIIWNGYFRFVGLLIIFAAMLFPLFKNNRDLLISEDMKAILYVDKSVDELFLIGKMGSYLKSNWTGYYGFEPDVDIHVYNNGDNVKSKAGYCDDMQCMLNHEDFKIAILKNGMAYYSACQNADLIVADIPLDKKNCQSDVKIIDRFDIWRNGPTKISLADKKFIIETVK